MIKSYKCEDVKVVKVVALICFAELAVQADNVSKSVNSFSVFFNKMRRRNFIFMLYCFQFRGIETRHNSGLDKHLATMQFCFLFSMFIFVSANLLGYLNRLTLRRYRFYRATHMHSADYAVARCLSVVCPSVCHTPVLCLNDCTYPHFFHHRVAPPF